MNFSKFIGQGSSSTLYCYTRNDLFCGVHSKTAEHKCAPETNLLVS